MCFFLPALPFILCFLFFFFSSFKMLLQIKELRTTEMRGKAAALKERKKAVKWEKKWMKRGRGGGTEDRKRSERQRE